MPTQHARIVALLIAVARASLIAGVLMAASPTGSEDYMAESIETLMAGIEHKHPTAGFVLAKHLFEGGRKDEAVFWFYVAQLRYRTYLSARPKDDPPSGERALFSSLMEVVGRPINEYAAGDIPALVATIDRVIAWDDAHPDDFAPKDAERAKIVDGLRQMKAHTLARQDEIRDTRARNGLPNRR